MALAVGWALLVPIAGRLIGGRLRRADAEGQNPGRVADLDLAGRAPEARPLQGSGLAEV
jgi:hypothetical protein